MGVLRKLLLLTVLVPCVFGQDPGSCYGAGSVAGAAIGAFLAALVLVAAVYYLRKLYWKSRKGKHLVLSTDPESVKDEFAFDNPGFRQDEKQAWQHDAPTLPLGGAKTHVLHAEFIKPEHSKDDSYLQRARVRHVKLWARDFTGLGLRCGGGAREGVHVHSVLRSGPAAAAKIQPGDRIKSIKIEFTGTPLEDAVSILSLASPYPVELEMVEGGRASGAGRGLHHPLLRRAGSTGDVTTLEKEATKLHPPRSPNTSHSNNSTLETIKKVITEKIIPTGSLERIKKERKEPITTLERENEKNNKLAKNRHSDIAAAISKPDRNKNRHSMGSDSHYTPPENGAPHLEHAETQKRESDPKKGMKFGIRVLPPNIPDDGVLRQKNFENGVIALEKKTIDEVDKPESRLQPTTQIRHEIESEVKKPLVTKRREKMAPPVPNARVKLNDTDSTTSIETSKVSENSVTTFVRDDLNSSGIKRDEKGIPQELPQHMLEAAKAARSNRKSSPEIIQEKEIGEIKKEEVPKPAKKSKGKAPSPPEHEKNKTDDSILEQLKNVKDFLKNEKDYSSILQESSILSNSKSVGVYNTSTPKVNKNKSSIQDSIKFSEDDIDDIVSKPFKRESDSLNNFFEETKSDLSSNQDVHSEVSLNHSDKSDKGSTTIELNNSDVTIHSSQTNETVHSTSDNISLLDENERKVSSLGDLSRFDLRTKISKPSTGTLERAQSLDISGDDTENQESTLSPKKRKAMSVVETTFFDGDREDILPDMIDADKSVKYKEPRLSLNIAKTSAIEGLNTFQRNRLKKASEFGNLEDAIVKGSSSSIESEKNNSQELSNVKYFTKTTDSSITNNDVHETSDHLAKRIMDENLKVHLKLVSEFAKSTSDDNTVNPLSISPASDTSKIEPNLYEEKITMSYDTNIPDDLKMSRNTYVNSLERPKSDMMRKLLAKNPILNVHMDQNTQKVETSANNEITLPVTDVSEKAVQQPDIVNFDLKPNQSKTKDYDEYVSNIKVGSATNTTSKYHNKSAHGVYEWSEPRESFSSSSNIVTISTNEKSNPTERHETTYTKSIEIGEPHSTMVPDVIEGIKRRENERDSGTLYVEPASMSITMTQEPPQKTVTVNVTEDEFGNKLITQNVEQISTKYVTARTEAPLQVEQISFGIMKNPGDIDVANLEEGEIKDIDINVLQKIKQQNPNMIFTSEEPSYTKTETIILNTELDVEQAKALMEKLQQDPSFMAQKSPEELSKMGIRIIRNLEDTQESNDDFVEITKTKYSVNPTAMSELQRTSNVEHIQDSEADKHHITEIQVSTPKSLKQGTDLTSAKSLTRHPAYSYEEPLLSYELDLELLNDFITNERYHSAKQLADIKKRMISNQNEPKKRHSDYDLPRNSHIKFRTATYESPKGTIVTSTDLENRRLSQLDQMQLRANNDQPVVSHKPVISAKPSSIPVKTSEKQKNLVVSSKIPIIATQKSASQENLTDKNFSLPRSPPTYLSSSSGNISVTSIKTSSRSPSGGKL